MATQQKQKQTKITNALVQLQIENEKLTKQRDDLKNGINHYKEGLKYYKEGANHYKKKCMHLMSKMDNIINNKNNDNIKFSPISMKNYVAQKHEILNMIAIIQQRELETKRMQAITNGEKSRLYSGFVTPAKSLCDEIMKNYTTMDDFQMLDKDSDYTTMDDCQMLDKDKEESDNNNEFDAFDYIKRNNLLKFNIHSIDTSLVNDGENFNCSAYIRSNPNLGIYSILPPVLIELLISFVEDASDRMTLEKENKELESQISPNLKQLIKIKVEKKYVDV